MDLLWSCRFLYGNLSKSAVLQNREENIDAVNKQFRSISPVSLWLSYSVFMESATKLISSEILMTMHKFRIVADKDMIYPLLLCWSGYCPTSRPTFSDSISMESTITTWDSEHGLVELRGVALRAETLAVLFETLGMDLPVTVQDGCIGLLRLVAQ